MTSAAVPLFAGPSGRPAPAPGEAVRPVIAFYYAYRRLLRRQRGGHLNSAWYGKSPPFALTTTYTSRCNVFGYTRPPRMASAGEGGVVDGFAHGAGA